MPPKKQQQQLPPYKPCIVLPIFANGWKSASAQSLSRPVNMKKNIDHQKIIQVLKDKGLGEGSVTGGELNEKGREFVCGNGMLKVVCEEVVAGVSKPPDPKKDAKKDAKKQAKKQQVPVPQNTIPTLQLQYQKNCNDFYLLLAVPSTPKQLEQILGNLKIDIVTLIRERVKPGSKKPDYGLLNNARSLEDMAGLLRDTAIDGKDQKRDDNMDKIYADNSIQMLQIIKKHRSKPSEPTNPASNPHLIILQIPYQHNLSQPETTEPTFLCAYFQRLCRSTKQLDQYLQWRSTRKLGHMIQPIREVTKKQVLVEDKNDKGKKGGKAAEPVYETVEQVVQRKYEDQPENIKSDLADYFKVKKVKEINRELQGRLGGNNNRKVNGSVYSDVIQNCLDCFSQTIKQKKQQPKSQAESQGPNHTGKSPIQAMSQQIHQRFQRLPITRINPQCLLPMLPSITYPKSLSMTNPLYLEFPPLTPLDNEPQFSFMELLQRSKKQRLNKTLANASVSGGMGASKVIDKVGLNQLEEEKEKEELRMEYLVGKLERLAKQGNPRIKWNFGDRKFVQKFTKQQLDAVISQQLLEDPQVFTGYLQTQGLKLLITSRTNPPGRSLYHTKILPWQVVPDFQNWTDSFLHNQQNLKKQQFLSYQFEQAGNLSIRAKNMMPTDNTIIRDEMFTIGSGRMSIVQLWKDGIRFGLSKKRLGEEIGKLIGNSMLAQKHIYVYWHDFEDKYRLRVFKNKIHILGAKQADPQKQQQVQQPQKPQQQQPHPQKIYSTLAVALQHKSSYLILFNPNPTIYLLDTATSGHGKNPERQTIRVFGSYGQITSYRADGSIWIYRPDGDVSWFRNGLWSRIQGDVELIGEHTRKLKVDVVYEGENTISIRQDQTITITTPKCTKTIFPDGTQFLHTPIPSPSLPKQTKLQIRNPNNGPYIRIYHPRDYNLNVIGYGSAFAYLGFRNILERSYDGYVFELFQGQVSTHYYVQRFDRNGVIHTEEVRLLAYGDGHMLKINLRQGNIVYVSPNKSQLVTQQLLNERWLQTFTTPQHHGQGVFDIDLNHGHIENKDAETNKFVAKVDQRSQSHIAVSFISQEQQDSLNFPNGFHIKQQNYFLPPPTNSIPARIFTINHDGSGSQYLTPQQLGSMSSYTATLQHHPHKKIYQYTKLQALPSSRKPIHTRTFTQLIDTQQFGLPDILRRKETKVHLIPTWFGDVQYRVVEEIGWDGGYSNVERLGRELRQEREGRDKKRGRLEANR